MDSSESRRGAWISVMYGGYDFAIGPRLDTLMKEKKSEGIRSSAFVSMVLRIRGCRDALSVNRFIRCLNALALN